LQVDEEEPSPLLGVLAAAAIPFASCVATYAQARSEYPCRTVEVWPAQVLEEEDQRYPRGVPDTEARVPAYVHVQSTRTRGMGDGVLFPSNLPPEDLSLGTAKGPPRASVAVTVPAPINLGSQRHHW
jgi:hypothetical protein